MDSAGQLASANRNRVTAGAARQIEAARAVLRDGNPTPTQRRVLVARVNNPGRPMRDVARTLGMTKNQYSSHLRRALQGGGR